MQQLMALGARGVWMPAAVVTHRTPAVRQSIKYLKCYYFGIGMTEAVLNPNLSVSSVFGVPRCVIKAATFSVIGYFTKRVTSGTENWGGAALQQFYSYLGFLNKIWEKARKSDVTSSGTLRQENEGGWLRRISAGGRCKL